MSAASTPGAPSLGPVGRLGLRVADHRRPVLLAWLAIVVVAGVFAPRVEHALSGAGWEATGSESVATRAAIDEKFGGQST
jgi:RND superfamily putative drug exporter